MVRVLKNDCTRFLQGRDLTDPRGYVTLYVCCGLHLPVGSEMVRVLHGSIARAEVGAIVQSKDTLITTSRFPAGALELASTFGYQHISGERYAAASVGEA